jgi:hypothetical protein
MTMCPPSAMAPVGGVAWLTDWELPFEGGFTLLSKFAWANGLDGSQLCSTIFGRQLLNSDNVGRHGRSMLDVGWAAGDNRGIPYLRDKAVQGALVSRAGRWTRYVAADSLFRYCPSCLAHGYQSALYQIEGMLSCPIHCEPLKTACSQCGAHGVRYAVTEAGFAAAFHCPNCMAPFAGTFNPAKWCDSAFRHAVFTRLSPIANWLMQLSRSTLTWAGWDDWHFPLRWHCSEELRRIASLDVLLKAFPAPQEVQVLCRRRQAPQVYSGGLKKLPEFSMLRRDVMAHDQYDGRGAVYKSVRRHIARHLRGCARITIRHLPDEIGVSQGNGAMYLSADDCPRLQAFLLWRFHFEAVQHDPHRLVLRPSVLQWPSGAIIDDAGWAAYCLASFYAAVDAFDAWRTQAKTLYDVGIHGKDRDNARALHTQFAPLLTPSILATFPAVSNLTYTDAEMHLRILVVGPADSFMMAPERHRRGLWCECKSATVAGRTCTERRPSGPALPISAAEVFEPSDISQVNLAYFLPMNRMQLPPALDGSIWKAERDKRHCWLVAANDLDAISLWLDACEKPATRTAYAQQVEKALIWCVAQRGIALSEMSVDDVNSFADFLVNPTPRDVWLPLHTNGAPQRWSPFRKAPSRSTQDLTFRVLSNLFQHWHSNGFILSNPWTSSKRAIQMAQERTAGVPPPAKRNTLITFDEWGYVTDAAGTPMENLAQRLLLALAYYGALNPTEIGAIRLQDLKRVPSTRPGIDTWSIDIPTRNAQRRRVFLLPQIIMLLNKIVPADIREFERVVQANPDVHLTDILDPPPCPRRANLATPPSGIALSNWMKPVFSKAAKRAASSGDAIAAQRLAHATLSWLSNALEMQGETDGKTGCDFWLTLATCKLCPRSLWDYLPDRLSLKPAEVEGAIAAVLKALDRGPIAAYT